MAALDNRDEGKFAPEQTEQQEEKDILYQMRNRSAANPSPSASGNTNGKGAAQQQTKANAPRSTATDGKATQQPTETMSREERQKLREDRQGRWHAKSGSQRGRERGQPNLGARMDLLLDKIKQG